MRSRMESIQEIQNAYSLVTDLFIGIVDEKGDSFTPFSFPQTVEIGASTYIQDRLKEIIPNSCHFEDSLIYDFIPGLKMYIIPFRLPFQRTFFLVSGFFLEEGTKHEVLNFSGKTVQDTSLFPLVLQAKEYSEAAKQKKLRQLENACKLIGQLWAAEHERMQYQKKMREMKETVHFLSDPQADVDSFLTHVQKRTDALDFIGFAVKSEANVFTVKYFHSGTDRSMIGQKFMLGEGFLGQAMAAEKFQIWTDIQEDPRTHFFKRFGLLPSSLFCAPVRLHGENKGLLFGGSFHRAHWEEFLVEEFKFLSSLFQSIYLISSLKNQINSQRIQWFTMNEILRLLTKTTDGEKLLSIFLDMSMYLMESPAACVVFRKNRLSEQISFLSRGMDETLRSVYQKDLESRFFTKPFHAAPFTKPEVYRFNDQWFLEYPIICQEHFYGILSVAVDQPHPPQKSKECLITLANVCGISLAMAENGSEMNREHEFYHFLIDLEQYFRPDILHHKRKAKEIARKFCRSLDLNDLFQDMIQYAIDLINLDSAIIQKYFPNKKIQKYIEMYHYLLENPRDMKEEKIPLESKIIFLAFQYEIDPESVRQLTDQLSQAFILFLEGLEEEEKDEMTPGKTDEGKGEDGNVPHGFLQSVNLSRREFEVLDLVLKGASNQEIAEKLSISYHTVKNHMTNILQKLGVSDRAQAIAKIYKMGYLPKLD